MFLCPVTTGDQTDLGIFHTFLKLHLFEIDPMGWGASGFGSKVKGSSIIVPVL